MKTTPFVFENYETDFYSIIKKSEATTSSARIISEYYQNKHVQFDHSAAANKDIEDSFPKNFHSKAAKESEFLANRVYSSIRTNEIKLGYSSATKDLVQSLIDTYQAPYVDDVLVKTLVLHITPSGKPLLMCKFLALISMFESEILPITCLTTVTAFSHKKYTSVKEALLMTIETLKLKSALPLLKDLEPYSRKYLEDYKNKVISFLETL